MVKVRIDYDAADHPDPPPRRRPTACVCDGAAVGPCPGPLNCPYSGLGPEDEPEKEMPDFKTWTLEQFDRLIQTCDDTMQGIDSLLGDEGAGCSAVEELLRRLREKV